MTRRTPLILAVAFGILLVLIALGGVSALRQADRIYSRLSAVHDSHETADRILSDVRLQVQLSAIVVRDFLLDPSPVGAAAYRETLAALAASLDRDLLRLEKLVRAEEAAQVRRLRLEAEAYLTSRRPFFQFTSPRKAEQGWELLQDPSINRRASVLAVAEEAQKLNEAERRRQQEALESGRRQFRGHVIRLLGLALFLGFTVAVVSIVRISRLEIRAKNQTEQTERAEQELRRLSQQLVRAQEEERASISRELHDEVGQMLTAVRMEVSSLAHLREKPGEIFGERVAEAKRLAEEAIRTVRHIAMGLRPSMLDDLGLGAALEWQARDFSRRYGVPVDVRLEGSLDGLPDQHRTCIYRLVQEALTNCARHARATSIDVKVRRHDGGLSLVFRDNGVGFHAARVEGKGLGLVGIRERVRELGGQATISSAPLQGTVLNAVIPIPGPAVA